MANHKNLNRTSNVQIYFNGAIPSPNKNSTNCVFTYYDFAQVQVTEFKEDPTKKIDGEEAIISIMDGKNAIIYVPTIKKPELPCDSVNVQGVSKEILSWADAQIYEHLPCAFRTQRGTIIPQVIIPSKNYIGIENLLISPISDKFNTSLDMSSAYVWSALSISATKSFKGNEQSAYDNLVKNNKELYGVAEQMENDLKVYINNDIGKSAILDSPSIQNRTYQLNTSKNDGAFAFCYKIKSTTPVGVGNNYQQQSLGPMIHFFAPLKRHVLRITKKKNRVASFATSTITHTDMKNGRLALSIVIPNEGEIMAEIGNSSIGIQKSSGSFSKSYGNLVPPQCKYNDNDENVSRPLIVFPTYYGMVITNNIIKNALTGTEQIFVGNKNNNLKASIGVAGASLSTELSNNMKGDIDFGIKFFPSLFQETSNKESLYLTLRQYQHDNFDPDKNIKLWWIKCLGNFSYTPIFFHKHLEFSLFFKGPYLSSGQAANFNMYVYPVINYRNSSNTADYSNTGEKTDNVTNDSIVAASVISVDTNSRYNTELGQTIYRANFDFQANNPSRYPLQVLGAVIALERQEFQFEIFNSNGSKFDKEVSNILEAYGCISGNKMVDLITRCDVNLGLDGVTGKLSLDGYLLNNFSSSIIDQKIGELNLTVSSPGDFNNHSNIFNGYAMQISKDNSEGNYNVGINLYGVQRKMEDMKLICAPFWDGDRLEMICQYFESYMNLKLKMISSTVNSFSGALNINTNQKSNSGNWYTTKQPIVTELVQLTNQRTYFRVPRSVNWQSPAQNFATGTSCLEALKKLAQDTSCVFTVGLDGVGYFYELNNYGIPYYVFNQTIDVEFNLSDIINISISPVINNKFNMIATFGFLQNKQLDKNGGITTKQAVTPGIQYTLIKKGDQKGKVRFPWARTYVFVQQGFLSNSQLLSLHKNKVKYAISELYQGSVTVPGNTMVYHLYQVIKINGIEFFVISIDHSIDLSSKQWTTTYGLNYVDKSLNK